MFKAIKQKLLNQNNLKRYLSYAVGEVILIVIGILVAVSINNWNEERRQKKMVHGIFAVLVDDLKQDTAEVNQILDFYNHRTTAFLAVAHDSVTKIDITACDLCKSLVSERKLFAINKRGFYQLNDYTNYSSGSTDSLIFHIANFYATSIDDTESFNSLINDDVVENLTYWRDKYAWFAAFMQNKLKKEDLNYFEKSQEYKNRVAFHYILIYKNYLPVLTTFQTNAEIILKALNERLKDN
jgi:hypothetical protein